MYYATRFLNKLVNGIYELANWNIQVSNWNIEFNSCIFQLSNSYIPVS